jgi:hypothetical protein
LLLQCVASNGDCSSPAQGSTAVAAVTPAAGGTVTGLTLGTSYKCFAVAANTNSDGTTNTACQATGQPFTTVLAYPPNPPSNLQVSITPDPTSAIASVVAISWTNSAVDATHDAAAKYESVYYSLPGLPCDKRQDALSMRANIAEDASGTTTYTRVMLKQYITNNPSMCYVVAYNAATTTVDGVCSTSTVNVQ